MHQIEFYAALIVFDLIKPFRRFKRIDQWYKKNLSMWADRADILWNNAVVADVEHKRFIEQQHERVRIVAEQHQATPPSVEALEDRWNDNQESINKSIEHAEHLITRFEQLANQ